MMATRGSLSKPRFDFLLQLDLVSQVTSSSQDQWMIFWQNEWQKLKLAVLSKPESSHRFRDAIRWKVKATHME